MNRNLLNWLIFGALSFIWGSSFILMKIGLQHHLTPYQVASLRIVASGLVLSPIAWRSIKQISGQQLLYVFLSGVLGSLLPAFLFCIAEEEIDSSLTGTLNSLTPIFVIITGALFFHTSTSLAKIAGIFIAFAGSVLLLFSKGHVNEPRQLTHVLYVVLATIMYGFNVNMVARKLKNIGSLSIAAVALALNAIPALFVLYLTGYFQQDLTDAHLLIASSAAVVLGIFGTAIASIIFYMLVKRAGGIFASMVTYGIPVVAIFWGIIDGEHYGWKQFACLLLILLGVYIANRRPDKGA